MHERSMRNGATQKGQTRKEARTTKKTRLIGPTRLNARRTRESGKAALGRRQTPITVRGEPTPQRTNAESPARPEPSPNPELQVFPNIISHANGQFWPHAIVKTSGAHFEKDPRNAEPQFAANRVAARSRL